MPSISSIGPMDLIDLSWYAVILAAIVGILQFIYQGGSGGGVEESHFYLLKKTVSLYLSISIITLTSCKPLPSPNPFKIPLLFVVLAVAAALSAAVPSKLWWLPYLSCIRPLLDLLRLLYLFCINIPLDPFWELCIRIRDAAYQFKLSARQFIQRLVHSNVDSSLSGRTNSNPE